MKINFYYKSEFPMHGIIRRKTDTGDIAVSDAALTAIDLVSFEKRIGGMVRAIELLEELTEKITIDRVQKGFEK